MLSTTSKTIEAINELNDWVSSLEQSCRLRSPKRHQDDPNQDDTRGRKGKRDQEQLMLLKRSKNLHHHLNNNNKTPLVDQNQQKTSKNIHQKFWDDLDRGDTGNERDKGKSMSEYVEMDEPVENPTIEKPEEDI
ncbi:hypothetical protein Tco_1186377 [Tanacetum coccineum]